LRSEELFEDNQTQLALEILDIVIQTEPENINARKLRINLLKNLAKNDYCLMSRNAWVYYINKDKKLIRSKKDR